MIYKPLKVVATSYSNSDGKSSTAPTNIVVGAFENEDSQVYSILCTIDKSIPEEVAWQEADRIACLLNRDNSFLTQKEAALMELRQMPLG